MKQPTRMQYFFAQEWPINVVMVSIWLSIALVVVRATGLTLASLTDWRSALTTVAIVVLSLILGFFAAILIGYMVLSPILQDRVIKNGGPFKVGDTVQILAGPHMGRISRVYSSANLQDDSVRVELGEIEKETLKDVFTSMELLRENDAEQVDATAGSDAADP